MTIRKTVLDSPVGPLRAFASERGVRALLWPANDPGRYALPADAVEDPGDPVLARLARQLTEYFDGSRRRFDLPLDPVGTAFQQRAWAALRTIPYGATRTYGEQAAAIGRPTAARAVGAANGRNPLSIVVPCHRVIGADGALVGFGGGVDVKRFLLEHESSGRRVSDPRRAASRSSARARPSRRSAPA